MSFRFGKGSRSHLIGVHPDLVMVAGVAILRSEQDFSIVDGSRTVGEQRRNIANGVSKTMDSDHMPFPFEGGGPMVELATGLDILPYPWVENDPGNSARFAKIAETMKQAAADLGIPIEWGWDIWNWDKPHWRLSRTCYPRRHGK